MIFFITGYGLADTPNQSSIILQLEKSLLHANTYYWFGMEENGNMTAYRQGLAYLQSAENLLQSEGLSPNQAEEYRRRIEGLRTDIEKQADLAQDTFYAKFPIVRFLTRTLFADPTASGSYELLDDPSVIASTAAALTIVEKILSRRVTLPQLEVLFLSVPRRPDLENEIAYVFNRSEVFWVHNAHEVASVLAPSDVEKLHAGTLSPDIVTKLCNGFSIPKLLLVTIREIDVVDGDYFYTVEARLHFADPEMPIQSFLKMGFSRDRTAQRSSIIFLHLALIILAVVAYFGLTRRRSRGSTATFGVHLAIPVIAFAVGRISPWIILPLFSTIAPKPEALATLSFWWPCAVGWILFLGPMIVYRLLSIRLQRIVRNFSIENKGGGVAVAVVLGTCAYLSGPLFLWLEGGAWGLIILLILGATVLANILGRALDTQDSFPLFAVAVPVVMAPWLGVGVSVASVEILASGTGILVAAFLVLIFGPIFRSRFASKEEKSQVELEIISECFSPPVDVAGLALCAASPPFCPLNESFSQAQEVIAPLADGQTVCLALEGSGGVGKTATAFALFSWFRDQVDCKPQLLVGECEESVGRDSSGNPADGTPFGPFKAALEKYFEVHLLGPASTQLQQLDTAMADLFQIVPLPGIASLVMGSVGNEGPAVNSREEIYLAISDLLENLARKQGPVILFIDDAHWIDMASKELLEFLLKRFPAGGKIPIGYVVAFRNGERLSSLGFDQKHKIKVLSLGEDERAEILEKGMGIEPKTAKAIAKRIIRTSKAEGELHWLFTLVEQWAKDGVFVFEDGYFVLSPDHPSVETMPWTNSYQAAVDKLIAQFPEFRTVLECAACAGLKFRVSIISDCLGWSRLKTLGVLDRIEETTGLVSDVHDEDDIYAFKTAYLLEAIRRTLRIESKGPRTQGVPQVIREYHALLARSLEKVMGQHGDTVFRVADHYYAAGACHVEAAASFCIAAAHAACDLFHMGKAHDYLVKAEECADFAGQDKQLTEDVILLKCHMSHVTGSNREKSAREVLAYLEEHPNAPAKVFIAAARACFDARGEFSCKVTRLGQEVVRRSQSKNEKAEGLQFVALSLHPENQKAVRVAKLREAMRLAASIPQDDIPGQALHARICNSLGFQLLRSGPDERFEAVDFFGKSINIKERPELRDLSGIARDHSGLGYYYLYSTPPDLAQARINFEMNLEISKRIGDRQGLTQMNSQLGTCDLLEDKPEAAMEHYKESFKAADGAMNRDFAASGLLKASAALGRFMGTEGLGEEFGGLRESFDLLIKDRQKKLSESNEGDRLRQADELLVHACGLGPKAFVDETGELIFAALSDHNRAEPRETIGLFRETLRLCGKHTESAWVSGVANMVAKIEKS